MKMSQKPQKSANDPSCVKFCKADRCRSVFALLSHQDRIEIERIEDSGSVVKLLSQEKVVSLSHKRYVIDIDWSRSCSEGVKLASTSKDNDLKIWRLDVEKMETKVRPIKPINLVSHSELIRWCPSLSWVANSEDQLIAYTRQNGARVQIMDIRDRKDSVKGVNLLDRSEGTVSARALDFVNDPLMMVLANSAPTKNPLMGGGTSHIKIFDLRKEDRPVIDLNVDLASDAKFTPDGQFIMALTGEKMFEGGTTTGRTSRDGSRNSRLIQICRNDPSNRNVIREPGAAIQHWDSNLVSGSDKIYSVTTVSKRVSLERGERASSSYYDILLNHYELSQGGYRF